MAVSARAMKRCLPLAIIWLLALLGRGDTQYGLMARQERFDVVYELSGAAQTFRADLNGLAGIEVYIADGETDLDAASGPIIAELRHWPPRRGTRAPLRVVYIPAEAVEEGSYLRVEFDPIPRSEGSSFLIRFEAERDLHLQIAATRLNSYAGGERISGDAPASGDLRFRTLYRPRLFETGWHGVESAARHGRVLVSAGIAWLIASFFLITLVRRVPGVDRMTAIAMGASSAIGLLMLLSFLLAISNVNLARGILTSLLAAILIAGVILRRRGRSMHVVPCEEGIAPLLALFMFILSIGLFRMAYLYDVVFPSYVDGARHASIVEDILRPLDHPDDYYRLMALWEGRYYHFGAHALVASISALAAVPPYEALRASMQFIQTLVPLPVFALVYVLSKDSRAALLAAFLAALGWTMPAHASDWTKLPALLALSMAPVPFAWMQLARRSGRGDRWMLTCLAAATALAGVLAHTRMIPVLFLVAIAWSFIRSLDRVWMSKWRAAGVLILAGILLFVAFLGRPLIGLNEGSLSLSLLQRYREGMGGLSLLLALGLLPSAWKASPRKIAILATVVFLAGAAAIMEASWIPTRHLIDRPFLEIGLYLPLSVLIGLGAADLLRFAGTRSRFARQAVGAAIECGGLVLVVLGFLLQPAGPHPCCQMAGRADVAAAKWIKEHPLEGGAIAIAASRWSRMFLAPIDGGAWLPLLAEVPVLRLSHDADLGSMDTYVHLCESGARYVYSGSQAMSFDRSQLEYMKAWYEPIFSRPEVGVYHLTGCELLSSNDRGFDHSYFAPVER